MNRAPGQMRVSSSKWLCTAAPASSLPSRRELREQVAREIGEGQRRVATKPLLRKS